MRQAPLVLLQKARTLPERKIRAIAFVGEAYMLQIFSLFFALTIVAYLYFVGISIMNVISNREASVASERLRSTVAGLEEEYFAISKSITPSAAGTHELTALSDAVYVRRTSAVASHTNPSGL